MSTSTLSLIYRRNKVRLRKVQIDPKLTKKQLEKRRAMLMHILPVMLRLKDEGHPLYFVDETMYTSNDRLDRVWAPAGDCATIRPNVMRFDAIAVVAAIDMNGRVVH